MPVSGAVHLAAPNSFVGGGGGGDGVAGGGAAGDVSAVTFDGAKRLRIDELRNALRVRGLETDGTKAVLLARLQSDIVTTL